MDNSVFWKMAAVCSIFFCFTWSISAQVYTPNGSVNTSLNSNIGIGTNNPLSRLQVESDGTTGLLELNFTESQGQAGDGATGGGSSSTLTPAYAFKLNYAPLNLASSTRFTILGDGQTFIGDFAGVSNAAANLNVRTGINVAKSNSKYLDLSFTGNSPSLQWTSDLSSPFTFSTPQESHIISMSYDGKVAFGTDQFSSSEKFRFSGDALFDNDLYASFIGVGTNTPETLLHVKDLEVSNSGELNQSHGIIIENNGWRGHDYSFEVKSGHGRIFTVANSGHVFIGSGLNLEAPQSTEYRLYVEKGIRTEHFRLDIADESGWADYVFDIDYNLISLHELENYIKLNKHLPGVPTTDDVLENGINVGEMNKILLQKLEELTLQLIEVNKKVEALQNHNKTLLGHWELIKTYDPYTKVTKTSGLNEILELDEDGKYKLNEVFGSWKSCDSENGVLSLSNFHGRKIDCDSDAKNKITLTKDGMLLFEIHGRHGFNTYLFEKVVD